MSDCTAPQAVYDKAFAWCAVRYQAAVAQELKKYGLRYDDLLDPDADMVSTCSRPIMTLASRIVDSSNRSPSAAPPGLISRPQRRLPMMQQVQGVMLFPSVLELGPDQCRVSNIHIMHAQCRRYWLIKGRYQLIYSA